MDGSTEPSSRALSAVRSAVRVRGEFESALASNTRPRIEDFLVRVPDAERQELFSDLLDIELDFRRRTGDKAIKVGDYAARFPEYTALISNAFRPSPASSMKPVGEYEIVRELGRGETGIVYEARQAAQNKRVALKILPLATRLDERSRARFQTEARAASQLDHPHIVPVFEIGHADGMDYYVTQFVQGRKLSQLIHLVRRSSGEANVLPHEAQESVSAVTKAISGHPPLGSSKSRPHDAALDASYYRYFAQTMADAASALQHAHDRGVVHRNIRPSNLLLDQHDHVWVLDFGRPQLESETTQQREGAVGTLRYRSPEQALAQRMVVNHRTDIYSLGVTFYEVFTLRAAYDGATDEEVLRQIQFVDPQPPCKLNPLLPHDLETIVMTAIAKRPEDRYQSAAELREDLDRFLNDLPILRKPPSAMQRLGTWVGRHRAVATSFIFIWIALLVASIATAVAFWNLQRQVGRDRDRAQRMLDQQRSLNSRLSAAQAERIAERDAADEQRRRAEGLYLASAASAHAQSNPELALLLAAESHRRYPGVAANSAYYAALQHYHRTQTLTGHHGALTWVALSADGSRLVTASSDHTAIVWHTASGSPQRLLVGHRAPIHMAAFSPDGERIVTASDDGNAIIWNSETGERLHILAGHEAAVARAVFSPDGTFVASASADGTARLWDAESGAALHTLRGHNQPVNDLAFDSSGTKLVTGSADGTARVWNVADGMQQTVLDAHASGVEVARFNADGTLILTAGTPGIVASHSDSESATQDHAARLWNANNGSLVHELIHDAPITAANFDPQGQFVATGTANGSAWLWDSRAGTLKTHRALGDGPVITNQFCPNGDMVAMGSAQGVVWLLSMENQVLHSLAGHGDAIGSLVFDSPEQVITASRDGLARIWQTKPLGTLNNSLKHTISSVNTQISPNGSRLLVGSTQGHSLTLFALPSGSVVAELETDSPITNARFSENGQFAAASSQSGAVRVWSTGNGHQMKVLGELGIDQFEFIDGDGLLLISRADSLAHYWSFSFDSLIHSTPLPAAENIQIIGGGRIASWPSAQGNVEIRNGSTGELVCTIPLSLQSTDDTPLIEFSPNGKSAVSWTTQSPAANLWNLDDGELLARFDEQGSPAKFVLYSGDGNRVIVGSTSTLARIINASSGQTVAELDDAARMLTPIAVNQDGTRIVTRSPDQIARLWNGSTGESIATLSRRNDHAMFFQEMLVTLNDSSSEVVLWEARSGERVALLRAADGRYRQLEFTRDGEWLVTADSAGEVRLWPTEPFATPTMHPARTLTPDERDQFQIGSESERQAFREEWEWRELSSFLVLANSTTGIEEDQASLVAEVTERLLRDYGQRLSAHRSAEEISERFIEMEHFAARRTTLAPATRVVLAKLLLEYGSFVRAEQILAAVLANENVSDPAVWSLWAGCSLGYLERSPAQLLREMPNSTISAAEDLRWLLEQLDDGKPIRINAGGEAFTSAGGTEWHRDCFYTGGFVANASPDDHSVNVPIATTSDDILFQTERWFEQDRPAGERGYEIPVSRGNYRVVLYFAEVALKPPQQRIFDVLVEENAVVQNYNTLAAGFATPDKVEFATRVVDGLLSLEFRAIQQNPIVSAIEILPAVEN